MRTSRFSPANLTSSNRERKWLICKGRRLVTCYNWPVRPSGRMGKERQ